MNGASSERRSVLVVTDDRQILEMFNLLLEESYEIIAVRDCSSALAQVLTTQPDVIICDVVTPVIDIVELCRRLKGDRGTASIPVLLISGADFSKCAEGLAAGVDDYLQIPFRREEFLVKVARLGERYRVENHYREIVEKAAEQKLTEEALKESEARYRDLFEDANDIIYTHDLSGNFTSLNRTGERITGITRQEAAKMNIADVVAPEYLDLARQMIIGKLNGKAATVYQLEIITKYGTRVRLEVSTRVIHSAGEAVGIQGI